MQSTLPRMAYILQIHNNPKQVNKFIHQLISDNKADVYIHIDKKNYETVSDGIIKSPNVKIIQRSIDCEWGDISQVDVTLLLLKEVMASKIHYDYICLRSGQDLLVKDGFNEFLIENNSKIFLNYRPMDNELGLVELRWPKVTRKRYTTAHPVRIFRRVAQELHRKGINIYPNKNYWPKEYSFYKGSQWFTVPFEVANYMVTFLKENEWYYQYFKESLIPDENFFHTLIMNSPYKENVINNNLLYLKWGETLSDRNSPQFLRSEDITLIEQSGQFFARKFDENIDSNVIDYFSEKVKLGGYSEKKEEVSVLY